MIISENKNGLTSEQALQNIKKYGKNAIESDELGGLEIFLRQFKGNYLTLILFICTLISFFLGEKISAMYIFLMISVSIILGFWNEYSAQRIVNDLLKRITPIALVERNGKVEEIKVTDITVGDVVLISTGSVIPADLSIIECENLEANESVLTGESEPVYKRPEDLLFMGTSIESGHARAKVINIGKETKYGKIAKTLNFLKPETSFQVGLRTFGNFLVKVIVILSVFIFIINAALGHDLLTSMMFALAIAVGLTPELLPVVVSISLSHGAGKMSKKHVIVKQLVSIENFGNMDTLCTDKTGTLTEGKIELVDYLDINGKKNQEVLQLAYFSTPKTESSKLLYSPIDKAIEQYVKQNKDTLDVETTIPKKLDEEPFDYNKMASFSVIKEEEHLFFIVKGSFHSVLEMSKDFKQKEEISSTVSELGKKGYRVIAVAAKKIKEEKDKDYEWNLAKDLTFAGIVVLADQPKADARKALDNLENLGIKLKLITGDNEIIAEKVCKDVDFPIMGIVLGSHIEKIMSDSEKLSKLVEENNVFAKVTPEQKLLIIQTLKKNGHYVGFLGDGINDAPALHAADVGISVNTAADVAKESASIVLLKRGLDVITDGVMEGRKTFDNTIKYILMGTSSNFGNMFSAAFGSVFLNFLPMTPVQILLNNSLYDVSQLTIPTDHVDQESLLKPKHWDIKFINKYMLFFGPISSIFDFITYFIMLSILKLQAASFQTGWFIESLFTQTLVIFAIRTARYPFIKSKPSVWLVLSSILVLGTAFLFIATPISATFGFGKLPMQWYLILVLLVVGYLALVDVLKLIFIKRFKVWN